MRQFCNLLSLSRVWLALLFFQERTVTRLLVIFVAMVSDVLDGYLARRYNATSRLGSILDPAADKIFFLICVGVLFWENSLGLTHLALIFSRDIFLVFFGFYLFWVRGWKGYDYRALSFGKFFTVVQFFILFGETLGMRIPEVWLTPLVVVGALYFLERVLDYRRHCVE
ncbi:CDP-alcohol phosphatidyltransferase family protein [Chlamydia suis]|uniref:CDP-diacylglycerol--glycerol-3-phosphate 3-phosphatidyltransferase n=1 Tax=Chlamydia suis TaxID=83559 RepID=A0AAQ0EMQ2_9CHLA|nr:CDP-alcohol phosphatidyltransferase family protein [Chlamydia suis]MEB2681315.1 CDP-alcohol phosphatidyltransferase family protein [Chlamydia suis]MEB2681815.1 CDP-alcohol phosphatidyltransferase family protein [Chlamydia suis]MEB2682736.1 CDP-alcohol phosphatidyltransferase family protein [Chlamydia suis]MEB2684022.1 CDP-alcohol phosphatidyltransferase family protein [Chlamydia suis]MEB2684551.1 CDP-alcohol phosphatidyltransferase family protein [Chlamydia suis]